MPALLNVLELIYLVSAAFLAGGGGILLFLTLASDRSPDPWLAAKPMFSAARWVWTPMALIAVISGGVLAYYAPQTASKLWVVLGELAWILGAAALGTGFHLAIRAAREGRPPASIIAGRRHRARRNWMFWIGGALTAFAYGVMAIRLTF
ncbi:hypothetical protein [Euryhalocaulis caribicus]|uniref:hypothetical protein n=1 Tax=Euryhalocaulis caribicus TaxID=1161401 RepID=UPI0003A4BA42|nr:hypothetical protein [Euryhalocaulis caribicus]